MREDVLGVSWLHGRMRFTSFHQGRAGATWECEGCIEDLESGEFNLAATLKQAVAQTGCRAKKVALVLEHSRLTEQLLETPPTSGKELGAYVRRQVGELKIVDEEVVSSWQVTHPIKLSQGLMLYLMPKPLQERLISDCRQAGLQLVILVSPTAVLGDHLAQLPLPRDGIALLAADTGGNTTAVAIGRKEGPVFLTRSLRCSWRTDAERFCWQVNRSMAFLKQQFQAEIGSIWLFGENAQSYVAPLAGLLTLPVQFSPVEHTPFYWSEQVTRIPVGAEANLISDELREAPKRKFFAKVTALLLSMQVLLSVGIYAVIEAQVRGEIQAVAALQSRTAELESRKATMEKSLAELNRKKKLIALIEENKLPPVPYWFLSYVADVIPDQLLLTELHVGRPEQTAAEKKKGIPPPDHWVVRLEGTNRPMESERPGGAQDALASLLDKLENGPFRLNVSDHTRAYSPRIAGSAGLTVTGAASRTRDLFFIEGTMRTGAL